jgi:RimJ/RimL family protein N-acetyltransferase
VSALPAVIETARLRLRRPALTDAEAIFEYGRDPEVTRFMVWPTHTNVDTVTAFLETLLARIADGSEVAWSITLPPSDRAIGMISCRQRGHRVDFGYVLNRAFWRRGFGSEAATAIVDHAAGLENVYRVWATCDTANTASMRVLEKAGLTREGILRRWSVHPNIGPVPRDAFVYAKVIHLD